MARIGTDAVTGGRKMTDVQRTMLERKFEKLTISEPNTGCLIWNGLSRSRYGNVSVGGRSKRAHRIAWELYRGEIPAGLHVCHKCDTPPCVNPEHLFLGDAKANCIDSVIKGRHVTPQQSEMSDRFCRSGHEFTPENTKQDYRGWRQCLQCKAVRDAAYNAWRRRRRTAVRARYGMEG